MGLGHAAHEHLHQECLLRLSGRDERGADQQRRHRARPELSYAPACAGRYGSATMNDVFRLDGSVLRASAFLFAWGATGSLVGCVPQLGPPPIVTKARLGTVIVYRNGVAYFERHASPEERELKLRVPGERIDDFLKSLTIADERTGEALPISYPTMRHDGGSVDMTIALPERSTGLRITYVTESPSWKPSYRLALSEGGAAALQAWAVVDNVSGEDWKDVRVGVGSTSALSFRFDLHSVRLVERQTLMTEDMLAVAPPTGGSPHAVEPRDLREAAALAAEAMAALGDEELERAQQDGTLMPGEPMAGAWRDGAKDEEYDAGERVLDAGGYGKSSRSRAGRGHTAGLPRPEANNAPGPMKKDGKGWASPRTSASSNVDKSGVVSAGTRARELALKTAQMLGKNQRLRVEGYAQKGDAEPGPAALARANRVRNGLIANGVPAERIDAIGMTELGTEAVRMVVAETGDVTKSGADAGGTPTETATTEPLGHAHFVSSEAMTIASGYSAMLSMLQTGTKAERVYYYDPISKRGSKDFAFNAIRLTNPSQYTLDGGPFTIYSGGQFLGEGLSDAVLPGAVAFIPYALDRAILVVTETDSRDEIERLLTLDRGVAKAAARRVRTTRLSLSNRGTEAATVFLRHEPAPGHTLVDAKPVEKLGGAYLFTIAIPAGTTVPFVLEEKTPVDRILDLRGDAGVAELAVFLKREKVEPALAAGLARIVGQHEEAVATTRRIEVVDEQLRVFRQRVYEINVQLVALRKVPQGERLRRHLATRMDEISARIQTSSLERAELEGKLLSARIEFQDAVAELTLADADTKKESALGAGATTPKSDKGASR
ncbi:MAG: DUF4139 domain-containing protein [Myxococcales bacterium]|nr:DUF4139 domain-containing protein [Myxococcales bacterium]